MIPSGIIQLDDVSVTIYDGPIGIMVSGGVDSAILLYYLMYLMSTTKLQFC